MTDSTAPLRLRPDIVAGVAYRQGRPAAPDAYKLSSNENPFAPHPAVTAAIHDAVTNRYPDASAAVLRNRLAERFSVSPDEVHVGAGSVSILAQLILATAGAGDEVIFSWRSFEAYPGLVMVAGATAVAVPNLPDHRHDLLAMAAAVTESTRLIIVCTPNNPTSTIVTLAEFTRFMSQVPSDVIVALDEAYTEFVTDPAAVDGATLLKKYPNLVVLRTFSKAFGLAGLRVGYALAAAPILAAAQVTAIPLSVTEIAQRAAVAALEHESELSAQVHQLCERRDLLWQALREQGWECPRPQGNFIWLPTGALTDQAEDVFARHGLVVRALEDGIRISIGEAESVDKVLSAAAEVVAKLPSSGGNVTVD